MKRQKKIKRTRIAKLTGMGRKKQKSKRIPSEFEFYDGDRLIRTLKFKTPKKAGFHRIYWEMDEKGPDRPARKISKNKKEPGGLTVKPGLYKVKMHYAGLSDSTTVEVKTDPRLQVSNTTLTEVYELGKQVEAYTQTVADAVKQLVESKTIANKYQKELKTLDKEKYKAQIKASKEITKAIDSVVALYLGKEDKRQGITRNPEITVMQRINVARGYVQSRKTGITATEKKLAQFAKEELQTALDKTNAFFEEKWKPYRDTITALKASPFKEIKQFNIN